MGHNAVVGQCIGQRYIGGQLNPTDQRIQVIHRLDLRQCAVGIGPVARRGHRSEIEDFGHRSQTLQNGTFFVAGAAIVELQLCIATQDDAAFARQPVGN